MDACSRRCLIAVLVTCLAGCSSTKWALQSPFRKTNATAVAEQTAKPETKPAESGEKVAAAEKPPAPTEKPAAKSESTPKSGTAETATLAAKPTTPPAENPFKPSRAETPPVGDPTAPSVSPASSEGETLASTSTARPLPKGDLNKETLLLIDRELRDATPEERAEWFEQLKHVDPALVPEILRARRMSLDMARQALPEPATVIPVGGSTTDGPRPLPLEAMVTRQGSFDPRAATRTWPNSSDRTPATNPYADVVPVGHTPRPGDPGVVAADYAELQGARQPLEHAVHRVPHGEPGAPLVLQNYEVAQGMPSTPSARPNTAFTPPRDPSTTPQPAGIAWPPAPGPKPESVNTAGGLNPVTAPLQFGSNLVQNVVGLVPGRNGGSASGVTQANAVSSPGMVPGSLGGLPLEQAIADLEREVATLTPGTTPEAQALYLRRQVHLRLMYLMAGRQERALTAIPGLPPAEQEFWQQLLWGMVNALDAEHMPSAATRAAQTIAQLQSATRRLQEQADLQIRHVAFCRQIQYFGNYEKLPRHEFSPGQEVLLYAELDNFKSDPTPEGQYRTLLRSTIELLSPNGELRKQIDFPATEDLCSTYRRDYFHNYQFRIPERMPLGPHVLKLTVVDELSGKLTSYSLNFVVK